MKTIIITTLIALISVTSIFAQRDTYEIQVDGLGCPFCAYGLEKKFKEFKGIKDVAIAIETGDFSFTYPADKALTLVEVEKQVEKAGYTPITTKITRADGNIVTSETASTTITEDSEVKTEAVYVYGNCEQCRARIEKTAKGIPGVVSASWDEDSKLLDLEYDAAQTNVNSVEVAIAKVGHDTKTEKASASTYNDLPACCQYERVEK